MEIFQQISFQLNLILLFKWIMLANLESCMSMSWIILNFIVLMILITCLGDTKLCKVFFKQSCSHWTYGEYDTKKIFINYKPLTRSKCLNPNSWRVRPQTTPTPFPVRNIKNATITIRVIFQIYTSDIYMRQRKGLKRLIFFSALWR